MGVSKTSDHTQIKIKMKIPCQEPPASSKAQNQDLKDMDLSLHFQNQDRELKFRLLVWQRPKNISKLRSGIKIPSQEPQVSSKVPNQNWKDMDVLYTFKIKIESHNWEHGYIKDQWPYQIKIKMPNPNLEPQASPKAPNEDLKDKDVLYTFKIKIENQNW